MNNENAIEEEDVVYIRKTYKSGCRLNTSVCVRMSKDEFLRVCKKEGLEVVYIGDYHINGYTESNGDEIDRGGMVDNFRCFFVTYDNEAVFFFKVTTRAR